MNKNRQCQGHLRGGRDRYLETRRLKTFTPALIYVGSASERRDPGKDAAFDTFSYLMSAKETLNTKNVALLSSSERKGTKITKPRKKNNKQ